MKYLITTETLDYCTGGNADSLISNIKIEAELHSKELAESLVAYFKKKDIYSGAKNHYVMSDEDVIELLNKN